jgi:hypothetical protein
MSFSRNQKWKREIHRSARRESTKNPAKSIVYNQSKLAATAAARPSKYSNE